MTSSKYCSLFIHSFYTSTILLRRRLRTYSGFRRVHCHTVTTCHPSLRSKRVILLSRFLFPSIFLFQKLLLVFGSLALLQLEWLCQKHPCTKTTVFAEKTTKSGSPGKDITFLRYFTFSLRRSLATMSSGDVLRVLTWDIISLRLDLLYISATGKLSYDIRRKFSPSSMNLVMAFTAQNDKVLRNVRTTLYVLFNMMELKNSWILPCPFFPIPST